MSDVYTHSAWTLSLSLSLSQGKTIKVYPVETVQQLTQQRIEGRGGKEDDSIVCSMPFVAFNEVSVKTKVSTIHVLYTM